LILKFSSQISLSTDIKKQEDITEEEKLRLAVLEFFRRISEDFEVEEYIKAWEKESYDRARVYADAKSIAPAVDAMEVFDVFSKGYKGDIKNTIVKLRNSSSTEEDSDTKRYQNRSQKALGTEENKVSGISRRYIL